MVDLEKIDDPDAIMKQEENILEPFKFDEDGYIDPEYISPITYLGTFEEKHAPEDVEVKSAWGLTAEELNLKPEMMIPPEDETHPYAHDAWGKPIVHAYLDRPLKPEMRR